MFRHVRARSTAGALFFGLAACSGSPGAAVQPAALTSLSLRPHADPCVPKGGVIGGICKTTTYTVPFSITGWKIEPSEGLVVYATEAIVINGNVSFKPGTLLALYAPKITIDGQVYGSKAVGTRTANQAPKVTDVIDGCNVDDTQQVIEVPSGDDLAIVASKETGCDLEFAGIDTWPSASGSNGSIASKGLNLRNGLDGGSILIGTSEARDAARRVASQSNLGVNVKAYAPSTFGMKGAHVAAGNAGNGFSDCDGKFNKETDTWLFTPGNGGKGGTVQMYVSGTIDGVEAFGGYGGAGGGWCQPLVDGVPDDVNAADVDLKQSNGGDGGDAAANMGGGLRLGGGGGPPGSASSDGFYIEAGNGWSTPTSAGNGGNLVLSLGLAGKAGRGGKVSDGTYKSIVVSGGLGATASRSGGVDGGTAGNVLIQGPASAPDVPFPEGMIEIGGFNGGFGQSNCGAVAGNGAGGGTLTLTGSIDSRLVIIDGQSFSGGGGGSGNVPGVGGAEGTERVNGAKHSIGEPGSDGSTC
jgi:hypothetical protein